MSEITEMIVRYMVDGWEVSNSSDESTLVNRIGKIIDKEMATS